MNWKGLYFGHITRDEIKRSITDKDWQKLRVSLKGKSLKYKNSELHKYLTVQNNNRKAQVRITNYVTALSRGGLIKPADYC